MPKSIQKKKQFNFSNLPPKPKFRHRVKSLDEGYFLPISMVARWTGFTRVTIARMVKDGKFPAGQHTLGTKRIYWPRPVVEAWIAEHTPELRQAAG